MFDHLCNILLLTLGSGFALIIFWLLRLRLLAALAAFVFTVAALISIGTAFQGVWQLKTSVDSLRDSFHHEVLHDS